MKIVQTMGGANGAPSMTPMPGGVAMPGAVECVPGPGWSCLLGQTEKAELIVENVADAIAGHSYETFSYNDGPSLNFYAFADNSDDPFKTTRSSASMLPIANTSPYADNPACP